MNFLLVALGGAVGATARYAISLIPYKSDFPILTLITNLLGALLIGVIVGMAEAKKLPDNYVLFLKTGVCGGFTTFSTFSLEAVTLFENDRIGMGIAYVILSLALCLLGVLLGKSLTKAMV